PSAETLRRAPLKGPGGAHWASRRGVLASWREAPSRSIGYFQRIHAAAPLTGRTESSSSDYLAPQTGLERMTFWLTAERRRRSHRCEPTSKKARHGRSRAGELGAADASGPRPAVAERSPTASHTSGTPVSPCPWRSPPPPAPRTVDESSSTGLGALGRSPRSPPHAAWQCACTPCASARRRHFYSQPVRC